ncbi:MAG: peptidylprolyl isomerase [Ruminococcaceae bacterium]|nr:peptidylprolyl isomerase [Oscillospiraceae bacterium]
MEEVKSEIDSFEVSDFAETDDVTNYVKITVEKHGDIVLRLRPDIAPETVKNFQDLVKSGHYDGKTFHRVVQNFMIQGGGFDESGIEASTPKIMGEFTANGFHNNLKHVRGVISMARLNGANNSATCQFFICDATSAHLDDNYASFGYVLAGMDTVDSIAAVKTLEEKPILTVKIEKVVFVDPLK